MVKTILIILSGMILCTNYYAQQKPFGYKISGNGDIISDVFLVKKGFVLDSAVALRGEDYYKSYQFEYDKQGKLKRDINFYTYTVYGDGYMKLVPGCREYFYNEKGNIDSVLYGAWNDTTQVYDYTGSNIKYSYDDDGRLLSKIYTIVGLGTKIEENTYDSNGNLILNKVTSYYSGNTECVREYDSQNRLISIKRSYEQLTYQYDSSGDISCTVQSGDHNLPPTIYLFKFDEAGKVISENQRNFNYDDNNNIIKMGETGRFHYNADGNLDTLLNSTLVGGGGYLSNRATLVDSYGNEIIFPDYKYKYCFYYSKIITDVKKYEASFKNFVLSQNYPNPFNPSTTIDYSIPQNSFVSLKVYDLLGKEVATLVNEEKSIGNYEIDFDGSNLSSGVYFYRIQAGNFSDTKKFILLR